MLLVKDHIFKKHYLFYAFVFRFMSVHTIKLGFSFLAHVRTCHEFYKNFHVTLYADLLLMNALKMPDLVCKLYEN